MATAPRWRRMPRTPMSPQIVQRLLDAGAWGATVANLQQAAVLLRAGVRRLMLGNEIGGLASGARLGQLLAAYPDARLLAFADSADTVRALAAAAGEAGRPVDVLVEVGGGRAGARDGRRARHPGCRAGPGRQAVAGRRGHLRSAVASSDPEATRRNIAALMARAIDALHQVRALAPAAPLVFTAGGSAFFDQVTQALEPALRQDGNTLLVLRSGAIFFHDHGVYRRALDAMDQRAGFEFGGERHSAADFQPALRLWGEVLSRPEPGLAICGFGMRDVSYDQDLPTPLAAYRDGRPVAGWNADAARVAKLNDQHAFLALPTDSTLAPGDVVEFGISHPCTCLDRWRVFFGLDADGRVSGAYHTYFG